MTITKPIHNMAAYAITLVLILFMGLALLNTKAALNDSWDENYGAGAVRDGPNIPLGLGADTDVKFFYDHKSHWITDNVNSIVATVPGSFHSELRCPGDGDGARAGSGDARQCAVPGLLFDHQPRGTPPN